MREPTSSKRQQGRLAEAFGLRLAALRLRNNVTQAELAGRIGSSQVQVSRWETGKVFPGAARRRALARALGVGDGQLLDRGRGDDQGA